MIQNGGTQAFTTADVVIGTSGKPTRVFSINFLSGATASVINVRNGTSTAGTALIREDGVISSAKTVNYGTVGVFFPAGCFLDVDANTVSGSISYSQEMG
jgi:hypothetical protein